MRILVSGGAGFIGSNFIQYVLRETDHEIANLDKLTYAGHLESLTAEQTNPRYQFFRADIVDEIQVDRVFQDVDPDAVLHLAAETHVDRSIDYPNEFVQTNTVGTFNLLQSAHRHFQRLPLARRQAFRFLHVSTDEVYGGLENAGAPFSEAAPYDPHSPYAASKAAADHFARAWHETYGLPVLLTNCSNNYGPQQFPEKLIPLAILRALRHQSIPLYGLGENIRDWLYVEDHVRALLHVLSDGRTGETYHIGGNQEWRNIDVVRQLCDFLDERRPLDNTLGLSSYSELIEFVTDRPGHDLRYAVDAGRIRAELGWSPKETFDSGLQKTVEWYLENQSWCETVLAGRYNLERLGLRADNLAE